MATANRPRHRVAARATWRALVDLTRLSIRWVLQTAAGVVVIIGVGLMLAYGYVGFQAIRAGIGAGRPGWVVVGLVPVVGPVAIAAGVVRSGYTDMEGKEP